MRARLEGDGAILRRLSEIRLGEEIRRLREARGMSLRQLAAELDISPPFLSDVEHGRRGVTAARLPKLAEILGTTLEHLSEVSGICPHCGGCGLVESKKRRGGAK